MRYAIIENGIVVNIAEAEFPLADNWIAGETANRGDTYVDGTFIPSEPEPEPEPPWRLTKLAFKNRFPREKWIAARQAAAANALLADFFESFELATFIDLQQGETRAGVMALTADAIPEAIRLTLAEADAVLTTPAAAHEMPL
jgi:hypothetical protein